MKYLRGNRIYNRRVLLRCDFNVPIKEGKVVDTTKIDKSLDTISYLLSCGNTVIIFSHLGRVKTEEDKKKNSLYPVYEYLKKYIDIEFVESPFDLSKTYDGNRCYLVENTRYTDLTFKKESKNNLELAKYWSTFGDLFVVDAFASLHRAHSSTAGISKYLDTYLGFLVEKEIENLEPLLTPKKPFVVIMGGAKVDDKIKIIKELIVKCDYILLTGGILNTFLYVSGFNIGNSIKSTDEEVISEVKKLINSQKSKTLCSLLFNVKTIEGNIETKHIKDIISTDIIVDNIINKDISSLNPSMVFVNGTPGMYEDESSIGTEKLFNMLLNCNADVYIGGGDTVSATNKYNLTPKFKYASSGGGATLEYVAYGKLDALEYIKENETSK